uniref:Uncharacterized protein n=1 Tax=Pseudo-nitzschia australis TaxID=44445 RepID=A0A7S4ENS1_9STRA
MTNTNNTVLPIVFAENLFGANVRHQSEAIADIGDVNVAPSTTAMATKRDKDGRDAPFSSPDPRFSEYTTFAKTSDGFLYPTKFAATPHRNSHSTISNNSEPLANDESQEYTIESFNKFLENNRHGRVGLDVDHCLRCSKDDELSTMNTVDAGFDVEEDLSFYKEKAEVYRDKQHVVWPKRLLRSPDLMTDAPTGILLVFDRMLDCIDPHNGPNKLIDFGSLDDDDQSSLWSLALSHPSLLRDFGEQTSSSACSLTTDECSLDFNPLFSRHLSNDWPPLVRERHKTKPIPEEELSDGFDWIFPCWEDPDAELASKSLRDLAATDVGRKRKWTGKDLQSVNKATTITTYHYTDVELYGEASGGNVCEERENNAEIPRFRDFGGEPFDFPSRESSLLKLHEPIPGGEAMAVCGKNLVVNNSDESSNSSLSELFDGLIVWSPSDEKEDEDELDRILDRTSITEETSTLTLSYSSATY